MMTAKMRIRSHLLELTESVFIRAVFRGKACAIDRVRFRGAKFRQVSRYSDFARAPRRVVRPELPFQTRHSHRRPRPMFAARSGCCLRVTATQIRPTEQLVIRYEWNRPDTWRKSRQDRSSRFRRASRFADSSAIEQSLPELRLLARAVRRDYPAPR